MEYVFKSFRHSLIILQEKEFILQFVELTKIIESITEDDLIDMHNSFGLKKIEKTPKSLSKAINRVFKKALVKQGWKPESKIFQDSEYEGETWRLDFAKKNISIEVGFNHSSVIAWNLLKPVLASELNHVNKAIQTKIGVIITATEALKINGGFDKAIGTYEKYIEYLRPLNNLLTVPLLIIGLNAPETFKIEHYQLAPRKKIGRIVML